MTLGELKDRVMFQTSNDSEDVGDFLPALEGYINDAYDQAVNAWAKRHVPSEEYPMLQEPPEPEPETSPAPSPEPSPEPGEEEEEEEEEETTPSSEEPPVDVPRLPEWIHPYLADWATWLVYRNGNPNKQNRGYPFRESFARMLATIAREGGAAGVDSDGNPISFKYFRNIPR